ncbi:MAG TPA: SpoIIE family protein phosphatase [Terriglobales bacterium]|nr:SpoIIE family protein phosphatase [Terriglobales bacterium]
MVDQDLLIGSDRQSVSSLKRTGLRLLAIIFAGTLIAYSAIWMYYIRLPSPTLRVEIGFEESYSPNGIEIYAVHPGSPAEKSGLKVNDRIVAINGGTAASASAWNGLMRRTWLSANPGDAVTLTLQRPGQSQPLVITPRFRARQGVGDTRGLGRTIAVQIADLYPMLFLVVGLAVLFLRMEDRNAWLLALLFATFIAAADMPDEFVAAPAHLRSFLLAYRTLMGSVLTGLFYFFFAVFPARSPIERKVPWLKWALLASAICLSLGGYRQGNSIPLPVILAAVPEPIARDARRVVVYGSIFLGLISLLWNRISASNTDDVRKIKVIFWGTVVGVTPAAAIALVQEVFYLQVSFWPNFAKVILLFLFPLSFAYAVVKHRVMDIPVLLKRSARYFVVERGFLLLILLLSVGLTLWFGQAFSHYFSAGSKAAIPIGATFGVLVISSATQIHRRVRTRLDRAFFRSSYDAQQILEDLAAKTLNTSSREGLALLLRQNIWDALHPRTMFVYLQGNNGQLLAYAGNPPAAATTLSRSAAGIAELAERDGPVELMPEEMRGTQLGPLNPECVVPIHGSGKGVLEGVAVLGPRLSEEPYSSSDMRLLASVASHAGIAMRSITLAEKMAERMEAERRTAQEMEIARQVQSRLLPLCAPALRTLECTGKCIQSRAVGGDYYDFLDLGSGRVGLVLADISGKGMSGALLMANLQANLRSQYALALEDISHLLRSVNKLFYENTEINNYATMFFAAYDDEDRVLRYVNCGHNPPILLRATGEIERLNATATVLGLFERWDCAVEKRTLHDGDVLVIYTDGISEASPDENDEFGDARLIEVLRAHRQQSAAEVLQAIVAEVQSFSQGVQADDMTLITARCKALQPLLVSSPGTSLNA